MRTMTFQGSDLEVIQQALAADVAQCQKLARDIRNSVHPEDTKSLDSAMNFERKAAAAELLRSMIDAQPEQLRAVG